MVIGTGGKVINEIKELTGVEIDIEEDGTVYITGEAKGAEKAKIAIEEIVREYKEGDKFVGEVLRVADFGAIVKIGPKSDGLVHVSEISRKFVRGMKTYLKTGSKIVCEVMSVDAGKKFIELSMRRAGEGQKRTKLKENETQLSNLFLE